MFAPSWKSPEDSRIILLCAEKNRALCLPANSLKQPPRCQIISAINKVYACSSILINSIFYSVIFSIDFPYYFKKICSPVSISSTSR